MSVDGRETTFVTRHAGSQRNPETGAGGTVPLRTEPSSFGNLFKRKLDGDMIVVGDQWLKESGVQQQLEFEGYQLRWVTIDKLDLNVAEGWQYVTVSHYLWWHRRVRRRYGPRNQYLLKRAKSFRSRDDSYS